MTWHKGHTSLNTFKALKGSPTPKPFKSVPFLKGETMANFFLARALLEGGDYGQFLFCAPFSATHPLSPFVWAQSYGRLFSGLFPPKFFFLVFLPLPWFCLSLCFSWLFPCGIEMVQDASRWSQDGPRGFKMASRWSQVGC